MSIQMLKRGETLPINEALAGLVPMATDAEQAVLTEDIKKNGLMEPIVVWSNEVVDGRCRMKACISTGTQILYRELDNELSYEDVAIFVKAVNTRRNLTHTQKVMVAVNVSYNTDSSIVKASKAWGVSDKLVKNGRWLKTNHPDIAQALFDGKSVNLVDKVSNKVTTVYSFYRALSEDIKEQESTGWTTDSFIHTQAGKDWYYSLVNAKDVKDIELRMALAELANFKFNNGSNDSSITAREQENIAEVVKELSESL